jgi:hypothetical protein
VRAPALALLATLALAAALPAQKEGGEAARGGMAVSVVVDHPVGRVYRRAIDVMHAAGYRALVMHQNEMLLTPEPVVVPAATGQTPTMAQITFEARGDSTKIQVQVVPMDTKRKTRCATAPCNASALMLGMSLVRPLTSGLDSLPPEPRTAADSLRDAKAYGYAPENPVRVGGGRESGVLNQRAFLRSLRGPGGEAVGFFRLGSCCPFTAPGETQALARIDAYEVTYPGLPKPVLLYFDIYEDADRAGPPHGFTRAPEAAGPST